MEGRQIVRQRLTFTGHVQGVGFRFQAKYAASQFGLTGWVKNEWDGSVVMEVQGTQEMIDRMLQTINEDSYISISWIESRDIPVEEDDTGFHVRHW